MRSHDGVIDQRERPGEHALCAMRASCLLLIMWFTMPGCYEGTVSSSQPPSGGGCYSRPASYRCDYDSDCVPYKCNIMHICESYCISSYACATGYVCSDRRCHQAGTCGACDSDSDCGTYKCHSNSCKTSCIYSYDCGSGYVCSGMRCVVPGKNGACEYSSQCGGYHCNTSRSKCESSCISDADCNLGYRCRHGSCVATNVRRK